MTADEFQALVRTLFAAPLAAEPRHELRRQLSRQEGRPQRQDLQERGRLEVVIPQAAPVAPVDFEDQVMFRDKRILPPTILM